MIKRIVSVILVASVTSFVGPSPASAGGSKKEPFAEKVKAGVNKLGTGPETHVEITLRDHTKVKGYISQVRDNDFTVTEDKAGKRVDIPYSEVKDIKGRNSTTQAKVALSAGGGVATPLIFAVGVIGGILIVVSLLLRGS
jgi:hypothetical protein